MSKGTASKTLDTIKWLVSLAIFTAAIVGNSYLVEVAFLYKVLGVVFLFIIGLIVLATTNFGSNSIKLMRESRTEIRKVVWPTRVETTQTFLVVFISIIVLCLFFWGLEALLSYLTKLVLG
jgi:preprotein translocase subunit SecE